MNALYQALRSQDPHNFEHLIFHLLKARYPNQEIKKVDGSAGDQGLDVISGCLDDNPTIWQCKSFASDNRKSQRAQIKKSLDRALASFRPRRWVLCLSSDMDSKLMRWFQKLKASHTHNVDIGLLQATDIIHQLLYYNSIREKFFPHVVLNISEIREIVAKTGDLSDSELAALTNDNIQSYLARLQARDSRFAYAVTFSRDHRVASRPDSNEIVTIAAGENVLRVFPRDAEALRESPPKATISFAGAGVNKFKDHLLTGVTQDFTAEEVTKFSSDFDFLWPSGADLTKVSLRIQQREGKRVFPLRVTFGSGSNSVVYNYVPFRRMHSGREEATFENDGQIPFKLKIILKNDGTGRLDFEDTGANVDVVEMQRAYRGLKAAAVTRYLELFNLETNALFVKAECKLDLPSWMDAIVELLDNAVSVSSGYGVSLIWNTIVTREDAEALHYLKSILSGMTLCLGEVCVSIVKDDATAHNLRAVPRGHTRFVAVTEGQSILVLGKQILTGPLVYEFEGARIVNLDEVRTRVEAQEPGSPVELRLATPRHVVVRRSPDPNVQPALKYGRIPAKRP